MGNPQSSRAFRLGPAADVAVQNTLTNAVAYPSTLGVKPDDMTGILDEDGIASAAFQQGGIATFGTATLQRQVSFDRINWLNDGAAQTTGALVAATLQRNAFYRWLVAGTGDITAAQLYVG